MLILLLTLIMGGCLKKKIKYGFEEVKGFALEDAKVSADNAIFTEVKLEKISKKKEEKEITYYIAFNSDGLSYTYYVSAITGNVVYKTKIFSQKASVVGQKTFIGTEEAKNIALNDLNIQAQNAVFTRISLTDEAYEIGFIYEKTRYLYSIGVSSGVIISHKNEKVFFMSLADDNINEYIGIDKAKYYALSRAGLSPKDVIFIGYDLDMSDQMAVYLIEFLSDEKIYNCEINASTGTVHKYNVK